MFIPEEMMINKFVAVNIPKPKSMFARVGQVSLPDKDYSGDDVVPEQMRKVDSMADYEAYAEMMAKEQSKSD